MQSIEGKNRYCGGYMKIGFYLSWNLGSLTRSRGNVLGDELYATSLIHALHRLERGIDADLYAPNSLPCEKIDVMVYLNDNAPRPDWASKSVLYLQNAWGEGSDKKLAELRKQRYDGYAFISQRLLDMHISMGYDGIFLPFGVDVDTFHPCEPDASLTYDVAYVGNDIKGQARSEAYLEPATEFHFGLYGNWRIPRSRFRVWRNWMQPHYRKRFEQLSLGKIPQDLVPTLYRSSKINLNCTIQDCVDWDVITLRTLEVLACDGFLISDRVPAAERLLGDYMVFTDGYDHLRKQILYYLEHEDERRQMAQAGGDFVRQHFSIQATARNLFNYLQRL